MTGNPALDKILLGINGIVMAAAAGLVYYSNNMIVPPLTDQTGEFTTMAQDSLSDFKKQPIVFKEMVVNLYSRQRRLRFLNLIMNIEVYDIGQEKIVDIYKSKVIDSLIDIAGNMKPEELNSVTGKMLLESRVKNKVNDFVKKPIIKKIYFSKFIVQ
jgi:flagellar FliL protein